MTSNEFDSAQKRIRKVILDVHPSEKALVVNYEIQAILLDEIQRPIVQEYRECQQLIRVYQLDETTDIDALTETIVERNPLLTEANYHEVRQILSYLQFRKEGKSSSAGSNKSDHAEKETANISEIDSYIQLLYEEINDKCRGAKLIHQLAKNQDTLYHLATHDILVGAIARVLREEGKKNIEIATQLVGVFSCFSQFNQFHNVIAEHKIGSFCMEMLETETEKRKQAEADLETVTASKENNDKHQDEIVRRKHETLLRRQDHLFKAILTILLNISEDIRNEMKIVNRGIVQYLTDALNRPYLQLIAVKFLKKLSVFKENKEEMAKCKVVNKLAELVPFASDPDLNQLGLRLLKNLSFDYALRSAMIKLGMLPKLVAYLHSDDQNLRFNTICILYHFSMDDRCKSHFAYTDAVPLIMKIILTCRVPLTPLPIAALATNLAVNKQNAQLMCERNGLKLLIKRALKYNDILLMKLIRNISQHEGPTRLLFTEYADMLCSRLPSYKKENEEFTLEVVGTLSNLSLPPEDLDWMALLTTHSLIEWIMRHIDDVTTQDDFLLDIIVWAGTLVGCNEKCAIALGANNAIPSLIAILNRKQEDDEIVLQIVHTFRGWLSYPNLPKSVTGLDRIPEYLVDLMHDSNSEIRTVCEAALEWICERDAEWAERVRRVKFIWHNAQWIDTVQAVHDTPPLSSVAPPNYDTTSLFYETNMILDREALLSASSSSRDSERSKS